MSFPNTFHTFSLIDFLNGCVCSEVVISTTQNLILCNKTTFWTIMKMCIIIITHNFIAGQLFLLFYFLLVLSNWAKCLEAYSKKTTSRTRLYTNIFHIPEEDAVESIWKEMFFSCQTRTLDEILIYPTVLNVEYIKIYILKAYKWNLSKTMLIQMIFFNIKKQIKKNYTHKILKTHLCAPKQNGIFY